MVETDVKTSGSRECFCQRKHKAGSDWSFVATDKLEEQGCFWHYCPYAKLLFKRIFLSQSEPVFIFTLKSVVSIRSLLSMCLLSVAQLSGSCLDMRSKPHQVN